MQTLDSHQQQVKMNFDRKAEARIVKEGDLVLKWDANRAKLGRPSKFDSIRSGPYVITCCKEANAFQISRLDGNSRVVFQCFQ